MESRVKRHPSKHPHSLGQSASIDLGGLGSPGGSASPNSLHPAFSMDSRLHQQVDPTGVAGHPLLNGAGYNGGHQPTVAAHHRRFSHQPQMANLDPQEPEAPMMTPEEKQAWDKAAKSGLLDRGCRLVWVEATANAAAERRRRGRSSAPVAPTNGVPWKYLSKSLDHHLCGMLTIPSTRDKVVDQGPLGWRGGVGYTGAGMGGQGQAGGYGSMNSTAPRGMNSLELKFVKGIVRSKQEAIRREQYRHRFVGHGGFGGHYDFSGRAERLQSSSGGGGGRDEHGQANDEEDIISIEAFVKFSNWWAPLMTTLSRLRNDWASTTPVRVEGFVGRLEAERKLLAKERGTFLLRFSESRPGALVVSFSENVSNLEVQNEGLCQFQYVAVPRFLCLGGEFSII